MPFGKLERDHDRQNFDCGEPALTAYLRERANQDRRRGLNATRVLTDGNTIVGYYTLSPFALELRQLPVELAQKFPANLLLPCYLIGRLAVDKKWQGQGSGKMLLADALQNIVELADKAGGYCAVVDAKNNAVKSFYEQYDFRPVIDDVRRLYLPVAKIPVTT
ncbi:N-acetyltransferase [Planctomycetales bacterium]|nr:N-acetyltransferase [Planctomycetales bacterium]GHS99579.1 N-acetyltransferase [Planctomycetales bacterium]